MDLKGSLNVFATHCICDDFKMVILGFVFFFNVLFLISLYRDYTMLKKVFQDLQSIG